MKKILILNNPYYHAEAYIHQSVRMKQELEQLGVFVDIRTCDFSISSISDNKIISNVLDYDCCIYFDKDKYVSEMLEKSGMRLFNRHQAMVTCDDKMLTYIALANNNIAIPKTLPGLLCYQPQEDITRDMLDAIEKELIYPLIVKESFGSLGKGVYKADNRQELLFRAEKVKCVPHHFQEFISPSEGRDVRIIVIGQRVCAAMLRRSDEDFRSNIELGGVGIAIDLPNDFIEIAERVASILKLDYCGIDVLFGKNSEPIICEVNSNAFFGGIEKVSDKNIAKCYAEYVYNEIYN